MSWFGGSGSSSSSSASTSGTTTTTAPPGFAPAAAQAGVDQPTTYSAPTPQPPPPSGAEGAYGSSGGAPGSLSPFLQEKMHPGESHLPEYQQQQPAASRYGFFQPAIDAIGAFHQKRLSLGLPSPGTIEGIQREIKCEQPPTFLQRNGVSDSWLTSHSSHRPPLQRCT